jgi:hypothetical protein
MHGFGADTLSAFFTAAPQGARAAYLTRLGDDDDVGSCCWTFWRDAGIGASAAGRLGHVPPRHPDCSNNTFRSSRCRCAT